MNIDSNSLKTVFLSWGWGLLFIASLLLGDKFINHNKDDLILISGLLFLILGVFLVPVPFLLFPKKGKVQKGESFLHTTVIIDSGVYGLVRHPQYLGWAFIIFSLILIKQHHMITITGSISLFLLYLSTIEEEKDLINRFGSDYRKYMKDVPRWNIPYGIVKRILKKKRLREKFSK